MGSIIYTAVDRGRLVSGHSEGTQYSIDMGIKKFDPTFKREINESVSLSGLRTTLFHRADHTASVSTVQVTDLATHLQMNEFYDSVIAGEVFFFDPYGDTLNSVEQIIATLQGNPKQARYKYFERWTYSFSINFNPSETVYS
jgi:hypothetical protein